MRIAILLPGHIRFWPYCKKNFLEKLYDTNHQIDVYIDTYYQVFSAQGTSNPHERSFLYDDTEENLKKLFEGINVVSFEIENQEFDLDDHEYQKYQMRKLMRIANACLNYENQNNFTYDLVVRSRFDIFLKEKIDYNLVKSQILENEVFIPEFGPPVSHFNDMFAIMNSDSKIKYVTRPNNYCYIDQGMSGLTFKLHYTMYIARNVIDGQVYDNNGHPLF